ncbi:MAG: TraB/GumN family protein [Crocinitomicaceae bacterium]
MIKTLLLVAFSLLILCNSSKAQEAPEGLNSVLWEVSSDTSKTAYLFGTMHLMSEDSFFFPDTLVTLLSKSNVLVMELNNEIFDPSIMDIMLLEEGEFFDFFSEEQQDSILNFAVDKLSISTEIFQASFSKLKPIVVSQLFAMMSNVTEDSTAQEVKSHEVELNLLAKKDSIPLIGFETAREQINLFDALPKVVQSEMVMEQVRGVDNMSEFGTLTELYKSQNVDSMYYFIHNSDSYFSEYEEEFLSKRNRNWIPKIITILSDQNAFVAVGAGHLGGPSGLIRLLRQVGYTVKPIRL